MFWYLYFYTMGFFCSPVDLMAHMWKHYSKTGSVGFTRCPLGPWYRKGQVPGSSVLVVLRLSPVWKPQKCPSSLVITLWYSLDGGKALLANALMLIASKQTCFSFIMIMMTFEKHLWTFEKQWPHLQESAHWPIWFPDPAPTLGSTEWQRVDLPGRWRVSQSMSPPLLLAQGWPWKHATGTSCLGLTWTGYTWVEHDWSLSLLRSPSSYWPRGRVARVGKYKYRQGA